MIRFPGGTGVLKPLTRGALANDEQALPAAFSHLLEPSEVSL
jgi:hypothetical protein